MNNDNDNNKDFIDMRKDGEQGHIPPEQMNPSGGTGSPEPPKSKGRRFPGWAIALIFLGLGLVIGISGFNISFNIPFVGGTGTARQATDRDLTSLTIPASTINNIDVRIGIDNLVVNTHNGRDVRVVYNAPRNGNYIRPLYNFNERTGDLEIFTETNIVIGISNIRSGELRIYLPETRVRLLDNLSLRTSTGRINVNMMSTGFQVATNANISSTTGNIEVTRLNVVNAEVRATTGRINLNSMETDNNLTIASTTGNINGDNLEAGNNLSVSASTGRINLNHVVASGNAEIRSTTGNITLDSRSQQSFGDVSISATTGRINADNFRARHINIRSTTGNININDVAANGDFTASASTGRIEARNLDVGEELQFSTTTGNITFNGGTVASNASFTASTGRVNISNGSIEGDLSIRTTTGNVNLTRVDTDMNRADINTNRTANVTIN
ncbi:MAG: DUF4097 domain-containing protein [Defluviitaleaceae bacterium]|nr:DUF4097 domain-containing protein [Defluviitaleaceae bacterium]